MPNGPTAHPDPLARLRARLPASAPLPALDPAWQAALADLDHAIRQIEPSYHPLRIAVDNGTLTYTYDLPDPALAPYDNNPTPRHIRRRHQRTAIDALIADTAARMADNT